MQRLFLFFLFLFSLVWSSCEQSTNKKGRPIQMGDRSTIVTETDSSRLKNYVRDISQKEQDASEIARIMVQVDSVKVAEELENFTAADSSLQGFTISFSDCKVIFENLKARQLSEQNPETSRSVSYLVTEGELAKMKVKIVGLQKTSVKERIYTKLKVAHEGEEILLKSLGRKISDWFPLAGQQNIFISLGENSFQFNDLTKEKLKGSLQQELTKKNFSENEKRTWMNRIKNTSSYTDAPCKLYVSTAQFRIRGTSSKGKVNKLIQFDIVE